MSKFIAIANEGWQIDSLNQFTILATVDFVNHLYSQKVPSTSVLINDSLI